MNRDFVDYLYDSFLRNKENHVNRHELKNKLDEYIEKKIKEHLSYFTWENLEKAVEDK